MKHVLRWGSAVGVLGLLVGLGGAIAACDESTTPNPPDPDPPLGSCAKSAAPENTDELARTKSDLEVAHAQKTAQAKSEHEAAVKALADGTAILKANGIQTRHYAIDREHRTTHSNEQMAVLAARACMDTSPLPLRLRLQKLPKRRRKRPLHSFVIPPRGGMTQRKGSVFAPFFVYITRGHATYSP